MLFPLRSFGAFLVVVGLVLPATSFALPDPNLEVTAGAVWGSALYVPVQGQRVHAVTAAGRTRKLLGVR